MKVIPIETFNVKVVSCCGERLTNVAEASKVTCPSCGSVYDKHGKPLLKIEKHNGKVLLSI